LENILKLKEDRMHLLRSCEDAVKKAESENRELSAEERQFIKESQAEVGVIEAKIKSLEESEALAASVRSSVQSLREPRPAQVGPQPPQQAETATRVENAYRVGSLRAFTGATRQDAEQRAYRAGQWARATLFKDARAQRWCQNNGIEYRAHSESVNTAGGFLVPVEMEMAIIDMRETYGTFRQWARVYAMGRDTMTVPRRTGGLTAYFTGEGTAITESSKAWDQVQLVAKKIGALSLMSSELSEDAVVNLGDDLAFEIGYAFAEKEDRCGWLGDGTSTYGGMTGVCVKAVDAAYAGSKSTAAANHDTFAEIDAADLTALMGKLPSYARIGAAWYCSQTAADVVFGRLMSAGGGNNMQNLAAAPEPRYLGYPIRVSAVLEDGTSSSGDLTGLWMLGFGNLSMAAAFGDRRGITVKLSDEYKFAEDQIAIKGTERFDINVHSMGTATAAGPFVSLVGG
jgi:HK97 family phage major capsid protein